jgi:hypothetical protein
LRLVLELYELMILAKRLQMRRESEAARLMHSMRRSSNREETKERQREKRLCKSSRMRKRLGEKRLGTKGKSKKRKKRKTGCVDVRSARLGGRLSMIGKMKRIERCVTGTEREIVIGIEIEIETPEGTVIVTVTGTEMIGIDTDDGMKILVGEHRHLQGILNQYPHLNLNLRKRRLSGSSKKLLTICSKKANGLRNAHDIN